jgi:hypothetical protein
MTLFVTGYMPFFNLLSFPFPSMENHMAILIVVGESGKEIHFHLYCSVWLKMF